MLEGQNVIAFSNNNRAKYKNNCFHVTLKIAKKNSSLGFINRKQDWLIYISINNIAKSIHRCLHRNILFEFHVIYISKSSIRWKNCVLEKSKDQQKIIWKRELQKFPKRQSTESKSTNNYSTMHDSISFWYFLFDFIPYKSKNKLFRISLQIQNIA